MWVEVHVIYVYAKYQKPTPYIKRDIANVKVFTTLAGRFSKVANHAWPKSVNCEIIGQVGRGPCDLYACQISKA